MIGLAQTGSGKTGAFALPILQALLEAPQAFFACILSPTRFVFYLDIGEFETYILECSDLDCELSKVGQIKVW